MKPYKVLRRRSSPRRNANLAVLLAAVCLAATLGCPAQDAPQEPAAPATASTDAGVKLRLIVVDDADMAAAIWRRRGDWAALSGDSLEVAEMTSGQLVAVADLSADAIIYSSRYLGLLAEREQIVPVRSGVLKSQAYQRADIFPLVQDRVAVWADRTMAVPLGSPVLVLYYRADLLEKFGRRPPATWTEYAELVELLADRDNLGDGAPPPGEPWYAAVEPLAPGWAGRMLLARAASYAKHRDRFSTLFDIETMEPLIAGPAFVRALEELHTTYRRSGMPRLDLSQAYAAVRAGHAGMAAAWLLPDSTIDSDRPPVELAVAELPGASDVYTPLSAEPEPRDAGDQLVPVVGLAGRLASVTRTSKNAPAAFRLLVWLSGDKVNEPVIAATMAATLFRRSHVSASAAWSPPGVPASAALAYARVVERTLGRESWLSVPRIPGADEYLAALDEAVGRALSGDATATVALAEAAARWRVITERFGSDSQREAYRHSLAW